MAGVSQQGGQGAGALATMADVLFGNKPLLPTNVRTYAQGMLGRKASITDRDFTESELRVIRDLAERSWQKTSRPPSRDDAVLVLNGDEVVGDSQGEWLPPLRGAVTYQDYALPSEDYESSEGNSVLGPALQKIAAPLVGPNYEDFAAGDAVSSVQSTLGQFAATPTATGYRIRDTYDFHPEWDNDGASVGSQVMDLLRGKGDLMGVLETAAVRSNSLREGGGIPVDFTVPYKADSETDQMNRKRIIQQLLSGM